MKVAHIITMLELGGAQQNTLFTVTHLDRNKFDVVLICGRGGILDDEARKIPNLKIHFLKSMVRPVRPWKDLFCLIQLIHILKKEKLDIVHTHSSKAGILGRIAAWIAGTPIIIHSIHGFGFNPYQKSFVRWLFVILEKWIAKITHTLIAVSSENIAEGLRLGIGTQEQYTLIRSGVDIQKIRKTSESSDTAQLRKKLEIDSNAKIILTVGPFKIQKNPTAFVRLAKNVTKQFPNAQFLMVGDGELRPKITELIQTLNVQDHIKLLGWRRDISQLLSLCDIFVLTSLWEGLPRAGVESLIVGKPVVAFAVDGLREIVKNGENGFLVPPNAVDEMAERIIQILNDDNLLKKLGENARKTIDDSFDIHNMVKQQEVLYQKLCA